MFKGKSSKSSLSMSMSLPSKSSKYSISMSLKGGSKSGKTSAKCSGKGVKGKAAKHGKSKSGKGVKGKGSKNDPHYWNAYQLYRMRNDAGKLHCSLMTCGLMMMFSVWSR